MPQSNYSSQVMRQEDIDDFYKNVETELEKETYLELKQRIDSAISTNIPITRKLLRATLDTVLDKFENENAPLFVAASHNRTNSP